MHKIVTVDRGRFRCVYIVSVIRVDLAGKSWWTNSRFGGVMVTSAPYFMHLVEDRHIADSI